MEIMHTGIGRISKMFMYPMNLYESEEMSALERFFVVEDIERFSHVRVTPKLEVKGRYCFRI